ncbi:unnamed protein product [Schistosoma margrebowiei]|uniref:Uncharacterized protein n=1 Tax=Schistosoma margrebowiei TaxID=48269 RepID=A0AA85AFG9_9TREM|nr:unnamed protein product [Schistosoma margrebowiei]
MKFVSIFILLIVVLFGIVKETEGGSSKSNGTNGTSGNSTSLMSRVGTYWSWFDTIFSKLCTWKTFLTKFMATGQ